MGPPWVILPPTIRMYGLHSFSVRCKLVAGPFLSGTIGQVESSGVALSRTWIACSAPLSHR